MPPSRKALVDFFSRSLTNFQATSDTLTILCTLPHPPESGPSLPRPRPRQPSSPISSLIVLDSSFNPPTLAHAQMARSALDAAGRGARLMLLLAVNNADKAPKPASFGVRLGMMEGLGRELAQEVGGLEVDLAVTTRAFFSDKAKAIAESGFYGEDAPEQTFLAGFDTLLRIFNPKYYSEREGERSPMQTALGPFFERARLRVTMRVDDEWGGREEQEEKVASLGNGGLEEVGGESRWVRERVDLVEGLGAGVSSSQVRDLVKKRKSSAGLVGDEVRQWIEREALYQE